MKKAALAAALLGAFVACLDEDRETQSTTRERSIRCSLDQDKGRGYPRLVYWKYAGLCVGKGKHNGERTASENVVCKFYEDQVEGGLIRVVDGTVNPATRDCLFTLNETEQLQVLRNGDGDTVTVSPDPKLNGPMVCEDETVTLDADDGCTEGILPRMTYDTTNEGAATGVQGVCEGTDQCVEYFDQSAAKLAATQAACTAAKQTWRQGSCSTSSTSLKSACAEALEGDGAGRRILWEKRTAREDCVFD